uniref:Uncharacterized protein n=1 Tax=Arundo donax TaxID=35708 RepID=A0A0A8YNY9_ARUDO
MGFEKHQAIFLLSICISIDDIFPGVIDLNGGDLAQSTQACKIPSVYGTSWGSCLLKKLT